MGTSALKSTQITNLDSSPVVPVQSGNGAGGIVRKVCGFVTTVAADAAGSTYRLVRIPLNARDIRITFEAEAQGAGKVQLSAYYSDSTVDGTPVANQGVVVPTTGAGFFADDIDMTSAVTPIDKTGTGTSGGGANGYNLSKRHKELWDALGLTSNPGGMVDIVAVVHTTAITTGAARLGVDVSYVV